MSNRGLAQTLLTLAGEYEATGRVRNVPMLVRLMRAAAEELAPTKPPEPPPQWHGGNCAYANTRIDPTQPRPSDCTCSEPQS